MVANQQEGMPLPEGKEIPHGTREEWENFLAGQLSDERRISLRKHLEQCDDCRELLDDVLATTEEVLRLEKSLNVFQRVSNHKLAFRDDITKVVKFVNTKPLQWEEEAVDEQDYPSTGMVLEVPMGGQLVVATKWHDDGQRILILPQGIPSKTQITIYQDGKEEIKKSYTIPEKSTPQTEATWQDFGVFSRDAVQISAKDEFRNWQLTKEIPVTQAALTLNISGTRDSAITVPPLPIVAPDKK